LLQSRALVWIEIGKVLTPEVTAVVIILPSRLWSRVSFQERDNGF